MRETTFSQKEENVKHNKFTKYLYNKFQSWKNRIKEIDVQ